MKKIKTLLAVGFLALLTSCGTTQQTTNKDNTKDTTAAKQENNRGRSNQDNIEGRTKTENSSQLSKGRAATSETVRNNEALDKTRMQEMYSSLKMDEDQVERFEHEWRQSTGSWKRSNRNRAMNNYERVEYQDRILKNILDESQFEAYQEWARENPMKD